MKELKISKEKVLEASKQCPNAKVVLKLLFPDVFEEENINKEIEWRRNDGDGGFRLYGQYRGEDICFVDADGFYILAHCDSRFKYLKKGCLFNVLETGK